MIPYRIIFSFLFSLFILAGNGFAYAELNKGAKTEKSRPSPEMTTIQNLIVHGNERIEAASVLAYAHVAKGESYTPQLADRIIKRIYDTGLFETVSVQFAKGTLTISVKERPIVVQIDFSGNKKFSSKELEKETILAVGSTYSPTKVGADIGRIQSLYRRSGYYAVHVGTTSRMLTGNRVQLIYEIQENFASYVKVINFTGNTVFSASILKGVIATKEWAFWRFYSDATQYDPNRVDLDKDLLRTYYASRGYIDFQVSVVPRMAPNLGYFTLVYDIQAGKPYAFGTLSVKSDAFPKLNREHLLACIVGKPGAIYNPDTDQATIEALSYEAWMAGYPFASVTSQVQKNVATHTVNVTYAIEPGPRLYIQHVNIAGNTRTIDAVLRRNLTFRDGDAYNPTILTQSYYNLRALDAFSDIRFDRVPAKDSQENLDLNIKVKEKPTGKLSFTLGYSTLDGIIAGISIADHNMLGLGRMLRLGITASHRTRLISIDFNNPAFLGRNLSLGVGTDYQWMNLQSESSYSTKTVGASTQLGFPLSEHGSLTTSYRFSRQDIVSVGDKASSAIKDAAGISVRSILGLSYTYDKKDDPYEPKKGWDLTWSESVAGLGGTIRYLDSRGRVRFYHNFGKDFVASLKLEAAYLKGLGMNTNVNDRYFVGGELFPGFDRAGVGPRDLATGDSLGALMYTTSTLSLRIPNGLPSSLGIISQVFTQGGLVGLLDTAPATAVTNIAYRQSAGFSIQFRYVLGIKLVFAIPIVQQKYDRTLPFLLTAGTDF